KQRIKILHILQRLFSINRLWFINNKNRISLCNNFNRFTCSKLIQFLIYSPRIRTTRIKRLCIYNHHADPTIRSKAFDILGTARAVNEWVDLMAEHFLKVILRYLERLIYTFPDSNTRYNNNEFAPAIMF